MNIIADGNNLAHRCYWISEKQEEKLTTSRGENVGCVYVFLNSIKSFMKAFNTQNVYVCWDKKLTYPSTNFRNELTAGKYKAQRTYEDLESLYKQIRLIEEFLMTLGIRSMYPNIMEGDDVIAYLTHILQGPNVVVSVDQDLVQLISPQTSFYNINKKSMVDTNNFRQEIGINIKDFLLYKAILGDKSDNISGLPTYGRIRARKLAENWITHKQKLSPEQIIIVENNIKLIDLTQGYSHYAEETKSYEDQLKNMSNLKPDLSKFKELCQKYEFKSYLDVFSEWESLFKQKVDLASIFQ